jgi:hypothetical protein
MNDPESGVFADVVLDIIFRWMLLRRPLSSAHVRGVLRRLSKGVRAFIDTHLNGPAVPRLIWYKSRLSPRLISVFESVFNAPYHIRTQLILVQHSQLNNFILESIERLLLNSGYTVCFCRNLYRKTDPIDGGCIETPNDSEFFIFSSTYYIPELEYIKFLLRRGSHVICLITDDTDEGNIYLFRNATLRIHTKYADDDY